MGQVAKILNKPRKTILEWCQSGRLPAIPKPYGGKVTYVIPSQALEFWQPEPPTSIPPQSHINFIDPWLDALNQGTLTGKVFSSRTTADYRWYIEQFFKSHTTLSVQTVESFLGHIPPTQFAKREKFHRAAVCFGKYLLKHDCLGSEFLEAVKPLKPKRHKPPKRTTITQEGLDKLVKAATTPLELALVVVLANTGLRASELCALRWNDIDLRSRSLTVHCGKGGKRRMVGLNQEVVKALKALGTKHTVFQNSVGNPLDRHGLLKRLKRLGKKAGMPVCPHGLRRAFVTLNANKGRPLRMLQIACGHASITTTESYCLTSETETVNAMQKWD